MSCPNPGQWQVRMGKGVWQGGLRRERKGGWELEDPEQRWRVLVQVLSAEAEDIT